MMRLALLLCLVMLAAARRGSAGDIRPGPVSDRRFELVRHLNLEYDVSYLGARYTNPEDWRRRAAELREQVLASAGLLPMPERTPLNAHISGTRDRADYTVENVRFESFPGFYVTGNLYRPKGKGPFPAVLNAHGHWHEGRFGNTDDRSIPGRCINLAKQGYVAFSQDMIGFNDSKQLPHKFGGRRERLWAISPGGLQLWNSIRCLDFLQSLPEVDPSRIACTGASGGGTQTFLLCAVDDRVTVSAPVNMISAHMQGGCQCENLPNLRIDTDNVEIGALMAPKPMLMVAATGDWTRNTPEVEFPAIRSIYGLLGAQDKLECVRFDAPHNYNKDSREAVYSFFGRWLPQKPLQAPVREAPFEMEEREDLLVFPDGKLPEGSLDADGVIAQLMRASEDQLASTRPTDERSLKRFREIYQPALRCALSIPSSMDIEAELRREETAAGHKTTALVIRDTLRGAEVPAIMLEPVREAGDEPGGGEAPAGPSRAVLLVHENGIAGACTGARVQHFLARGYRVLAIDCFETGSHKAPKDAPKRDVDHDFFDTYNRTDAAERVYDILLSVNYLVRRGDVYRVGLAGYGKAGLWCLLARSQTLAVDRLAADATGLDVSDDQALLGDLYVPCLRRVGDFRSAVAVAAPGALFIHNTRGRFDTSWATSAYEAAGRISRLKVCQDAASDAEIAFWLCE